MKAETKISIDVLDTHKVIINENVSWTATLRKITLDGETHLSISHTWRSWRGNKNEKFNIENIERWHKFKQQMSETAERKRRRE